MYQFFFQKLVSRKFEFNPKDTDLYAWYLARYAQEYKKCGINIDYMIPQNEPLHAERGQENNSKIFTRFGLLTRELSTRFCVTWIPAKSEWLSDDEARTLVGKRPRQTHGGKVQRGQGRHPNHHLRPQLGQPRPGFEILGSHSLNCSITIQHRVSHYIF